MPEHEATAEVAAAALVRRLAGHFDIGHIFARASASAPWHVRLQEALFEMSEAKIIERASRARAAEAPRQECRRRSARRRRRGGAIR